MNSQLQLLDVGIEAFVEEDSPRRAMSVEECHCRQAYLGMSCEQCAAGHHLLPSGHYVPCQCHGHVTEYDVNTVVCPDCTDRAMGDHYELFVPGYHGDTTRGTPVDCFICACPITYVSNNFAIGYELNENGLLVACQCEEGYAGARCEYYATGFYGESEESACACDYCGQGCAPYDGAFASEAFQCRTGQCSTRVCRPSVVGNRYDHYAPDYWGLASGQGYAPCDSAFASEASQCLDSNGQYRDQSAAGYWNYTGDGSDQNTGYSVGYLCNATGQCESLPGVIGENCDQCPERWVTLPQEGYLECDTGTNGIIYSVQDQADSVFPTQRLNYISTQTAALSPRVADAATAFKALETTAENRLRSDQADSVFPTQCLNYISTQTAALRPRVADAATAFKALETTAEDGLRSDQADSVFPTQRLNYISTQTAALSPRVADAATAFKALETTAENRLRPVKFAASGRDKKISRAAHFAAVADATLAPVRNCKRRAADAVTWRVAELARGLELSKQPKVDRAVAEATQIKTDIAEKELSPEVQLAEAAFANVTKQIELMDVFVQPVNEQAKKFENLLNAARELKRKHDEMLQYTEQAQKTSDTAENINSNDRGAAGIHQASNHMEDRLGILSNELRDLNALVNYAMEHTDEIRTRASLGKAEELLKIGTAKSYNDGKWYKLDAGRYLSKCSLRVDDEIVKGESASPTTEIAVLDTMNFGENNKEIIQVTDKGFDGCIRQTSIDGTNIDFGDNVESTSVANGCQFASLVSFAGTDSYLRLVDITTENLQLTLKFKTSKPNGLLFVYVSRTQTAATQDSISLSPIKGTRNDSRIEYGKLPGRQSEGFDLTITFRTFDKHGGLLFYARAERDPNQFLAFYMKDSKLHAAFNSGGETARISSTGIYNDTDWHSVTLTRNGGHAKIAVDSMLSEMLTAPYYNGGLKEIAARVNSLRCTDSVEDGVYFGASSNAHSNYLKNFKVQDEMLISMEVRARNSSGLFLSVHGKKDYLILEMFENELTVTLDNGNGPFYATYWLSNSHMLCDGNWHKIHVVKSMYVVSLGLDGHFSKPGLRMGPVSTDTRSAFYVGGPERLISKVRGVKSKDGFTGCLRNLVIGESPVYIPLSAAGRDTHIGVCPAE